MCVTCAYPDVMPKMIQVRNVPDELHQELVRRARARGQTLTDYIQALLERDGDPGEGEIRRAISGVLCRCTGYHKIVGAIQKAAAAAK